MKSDELKLNNIKANIKPKVRAYRASDLMTAEERDDIRKSAAQSRKPRPFDDIDAYAAEIMGRFGYDAYKAWLNGDIGTEKMNRLLYAERSRSSRERYLLENILVSAIAGSNHPTKTGNAPKSLKNAIKLIKEEENIVKNGGAR